MSPIPPSGSRVAFGSTVSAGETLDLMESKNPEAQDASHACEHTAAQPANTTAGAIANEQSSGREHSPVAEEKQSVKTGRWSRSPTSTNLSPGPRQAKQLYFTIGSGSEDEIRGHLREILNVSSVRIEPDESETGLSSTEVRILCEELSVARESAHIACNHLTLGFCQLNDEKAEMISGMLGKNRLLKVLNIWDNHIAQKGGESIGHGLGLNSCLQTLNIRSNDLGSKGALGIAKGLMHNKSLQSLSLRYNWIGDDGAKAIAALLLNNNTLKYLDISRNRIGSDGAQAIMKSLVHNYALTGLNLQLNIINDKGGMFIGSTLTNNTALKTLNIMDCVVGDSGCVSIFGSLGAAADKTNLAQEKLMRRKKNQSANHHVETVNIGGNEIGDTGALTIGQALKVNHGLVKVDLSRNRIMDKGATALGSALEKNQTLRDLILFSNNIGDSGIKAIADGMRTNGFVTSLDVSKNVASFTTEIAGILDNGNVSFKSFRSDFVLNRAQLQTLHGPIVGWQQDISNCRELGRTQRPLAIFPNLSLKLISLRSLDNRLGRESPTEIASSLGHFTARASRLMDLNLARNGLRCDHIKTMCFTSLTFCDLSQNSISNAGAEYIITSLASLKLPCMRQLDLTDNHIHKIPPIVARVTTLECLFLEGNPVIRIVALTAVQNGIRSITQWLLKWGQVQLDLAEVAKGIVKKKVEEVDSPGSPSSSSRPKTGRGKDASLCDVYPAVYTAIPCNAIFGTSKRFPDQDPERKELRPGPTDYVPWVHEKDDKDKPIQKVVFHEMWRASVSNQSNYFKDGAPTIAITKDLDEKQENAVLQARQKLIDESFCGRWVVPENWHSPSHPILIEKDREAKNRPKYLPPEMPNYTEKYGVKSIIKTMRQQYPKWEISEVQVIRVLKKHSLFHSDELHQRNRPNLLKSAGDQPPIRGAVSMHDKHWESEPWKSRIYFSQQFFCLWNPKKHQGFAQFMTKVVKQATHESAMDMARRYLQSLRVEDEHGTQTPLWDPRNQEEAACRVRDFIQSAYLDNGFKLGYFEDDAFLKEAHKTLRRTPLRADSLSSKLILQARLLDLFRWSPPPPKVPRSSWLDMQLLQAAECADVSPASYEPEKYRDIGALESNPERGYTIGVRIDPPPKNGIRDDHPAIRTASGKPTGGPGPADYDYISTFEQWCADKRIGPHYIEPVGGTMVQPMYQELVTCLPDNVDKAKHWLHTAAPSNGLQVKLMKQPDWLDQTKVGSPREKSPKTPKIPQTQRPATTRSRLDTSPERTFLSGTPNIRRRSFTPGGVQSNKRIFLVTGAKDDLDRVLGDTDEMTRAGLTRAAKGSYGAARLQQSDHEGTGPAYHIPSTFDMDNQFFAAKFRAGHVQTRDWLDYRTTAEATLAGAPEEVGPGSYEYVPQESTAYSLGTPLPLLPHQDPLSSARLTPSAGAYELLATDKTGKSTTFRESMTLSSYPTTPTVRIAAKTPYNSFDTKFVRVADKDVPGVGSYNMQPFIANTGNLVSKPNVPAYSMANDTHRRSSGAVTHRPVVGCGMLGINTDFPQRPQTVSARNGDYLKQDPMSPTRDAGRTSIKEKHEIQSGSNVEERQPCSGSESPEPSVDDDKTEICVLGQTSSMTLRRSFSDAGLPQYTSAGPRLAKQPSTHIPTSPTRKLSTLMLMDGDVPGMQKYNIKNTIGFDKNPVVRNSPRHTIADDWKTRSATIVYSRVGEAHGKMQGLGDWGIDVVTPRYNTTTKARLHNSQPDSFSPREQGLRGRHFVAPTSKSAVAAAKEQDADEAERTRAKMKSGIRVMRKPPKTAK